ncbi:MAG: large subunit ribosomal protein [Frankiaceae bacterium]|nr:large subunit ribosomal protein [Frankiaceae bacterium]
MARADKAAAVAELTEEFRSSNAAVLSEYRGLTVAQLKTLRRSLADNATYSVVKNTLSKIAARDAGVTSFEDLLEGPSAIAFVKGDAVEVAKTIRDFGKANPALVVKGGILDGKPLTADDIRKLADLEPREVLLAKLAGAMKASLTQAAYLLNAPLAQAARVLGALQRKAEGDPSVLAGGAGTPAPAAEAPAAQEEEAPAAAEAPTAEAETADASNAPAEAETADASNTETAGDVATEVTAEEPAAEASESPVAEEPAAEPTAEATEEAAEAAPESEAPAEDDSTTEA